MIHLMPHGLLKSLAEIQTHSIRLILQINPLRLNYSKVSFGDSNSRAGDKGSNCTHGGFNEVAMLSDDKHHYWFR